jgi:hypothetical protein
VLIIALVLAVIGLAALVFAVVTSNEFIAYICIAASVLGVILLIVDALRERQRRAVDGDKPENAATEPKRDTGASIGAGQGSSDEDYPVEEGHADHADDKTSTLHAEPGAGASPEPGGSDEYDHDTADQTAAGKNNTGKPDNTDNTP